MKKVLVLLAMALGTTNMFAQNLTEKFIMGQLPTTADDFQKYQFDYKLECAQDVGYDYDVYIPQNAFDGTNIFPLERNEVPIKSIECTVANSNSTLFRLKADFTSSGKVNNYLRKVGADAKYQFGTDTWYQKEWTSVGLTPCVPNSFACWTSPTRNSKGLIVSVSADLKYKYDSYDRVIEVRYHDNEFVYRYSYEDNSKRISNISISYRDKEVATASYTWLNDRICKLYCHIDYTSKFSNMFDEYEKSYKYDSHNNVSVIEYREIHGSQWNRKIYEFNNEYNAKGQLVTQNVVLRKTRAWDIERGKPEEIKTHTRSYTYDEKGNWVRIIENRNGVQSVMERKIVYSNKKVGEVDINNLYDDEEVETHANFGMTLKQALHKNDLPFNNTWAYTNNLVINIRFAVERDGTLRFSDAPVTTSWYVADWGDQTEWLGQLVRKYINSLPWVPATINNTPVRSIVTLSWKYHYANNSYYVEMLKDVDFSEREKQNYSKGMEKVLFLKAEKDATAGNNDAKMKLGDMYAKGIGTNKNIGLACTFFVESATKGNLEAQKRVAEYEDEIMKNSFLSKKLLELYPNIYLGYPDFSAICCKLVANTGNTDAQFEYGKMFLEGYGVDADINKAIEWIEKSANNGNNVEAMYMLGEIYLDEQYEICNHAKGAEWILKAAELGQESAKEKMAYLYLNGIGVKKNKKKAKMWTDK